MDVINTAVELVTESVESQSGAFDYIVLQWDNQTRQLEIINNRDGTFNVTVNYFPDNVDVVVIEEHSEVSLIDTLRHIHLRADIIEDLQAEFEGERPVLRLRV